MSYTRPPFDQADATWDGAPSYARPAADAADATWQTAPTVVVGVGRPAVYLPIVVGVGAVLADAEVEGVGRIAAYAPPLAGAGAAVVRAIGAVSAKRPHIAARGRVITSGAARPAAIRPDLSGAGVVHRYEVRGVVRNQGVLVNRTVRAYRLDTGALAGEAVTSAGAFGFDVGTAPAAHYVLAVDLSENAADFVPPVANRVVSELVQDTP